VAGHLAELVQRIETLCALLQTDRNDLLNNHSHGSGESARGPAWPLREDPYREPRAGHTGHPAAAAGDGGLAGPHGYGEADAFGAIDEGFGADGWGEPLPQPARFGA
jgi:hypothetical protein